MGVAAESPQGNKPKMESRLSAALACHAERLGTPPGQDVPVSKVQSVSRVVDSTQHYIVADRFILHLSPAGFGGVAADEAQAMRAAREYLGPLLGNVLLKVIAEGSFEERSYIILPLARPLSTNRLLRIFQKRQIRPFVFKWLRGLAGLTSPRSEEASAQHIACLEAIAGMETVDKDMRDQARAGIADIRSQAFQPRHCPMHGDLWLGNIMLSDSSVVIIDWRGSRMNGYGLYDLIRFSHSVGLGSAPLAAEIAAHMALLHAPPQHAPIILLAALGHFGRNLGEFPVDRFVAMARMCYGRLNEAMASRQDPMRLRRVSAAHRSPG